MNSKKKIIKAVNLYNDGYKTKEIANILNANKTTIVDWIKVGDELGLCSYMPERGCEKKMKTCNSFKHKRSV